MIHRLRQGAKAYAWHLSTIGLIVGLLWAGIGFNLWHDYRAAEQDAAKDTANLARTFDENITRTVEAVDQTLLFTREAYRHDPTGLLLGSWSKAHAFLDDLHMQISLVEPRRRCGVVQPRSGAAAAPISPTGRIFRPRRRAATTSCSSAGRCLAACRGSGRSSSPASCWPRTGRLTGSRTVSLDPAYLSRFYQSISIGNGSILLATTDGTVLARAPEYGSIAGNELPHDVEARLLRGTTSGAYLDGQRDRPRRPDLQLPPPGSLSPGAVCRPGNRRTCSPRTTGPSGCMSVPASCCRSPASWPVWSWCGSDSRCSIRARRCPRRWRTCRRASRWSERTAAFRC